MNLTRQVYQEWRGEFVFATTHPSGKVDTSKVASILERALEAVRPMKVVEADLAARVLPFDVNIRRTSQELTDSDHAIDDLQVLRRGLYETSGYWSPELVPFRLSPGILTLDRLISDCREVLATEARRKTEVWPKLHEFGGPAGRAEFNGQLLKVGDRVMLSESQAEAFADRFREVFDEQPAETS